MQDKKEEPLLGLKEILARLKEEMTSTFLMDSTLALAIIDYFKKEKEDLKILLSVKESFVGGLIEQLKQFIAKSNSENIKRVMRASFAGQNIS